MYHLIQSRQSPFEGVFNPHVMDEENEDQRILLIFHILDLRLEYKSF